MVECTGLENQQACKRLGSSNLPSSAILTVTPAPKGGEAKRSLHWFIRSPLFRRTAMWIDQRYAAIQNVNVRR